MGEISIIAAVAKNGVIGINGKLPWSSPQERELFRPDMLRFKELTTGNIVVMGRNTYESFPNGPLKNRLNIVLTNRASYNVPEGVLKAPSLIDALELAYRQEGERDIYLIGGQQVYADGLKYAGLMELTEVHREYEGDALFPDWDRAEWTQLSRERKEYFDFVTYVHKNRP